MKDIKLKSGQIYLRSASGELKPYSGIYTEPDPLDFSDDLWAASSLDGNKLAECKRRITLSSKPNASIPLTTVNVRQRAIVIVELDDGQEIEVDGWLASPDEIEGAVTVHETGVVMVVRENDDGTCVMEVRDGIEGPAS